MLKVNTVLRTDGSGYWSGLKRPVTVIGMELAYVDQSADFGELRVYFDEASWDVELHGLIYSDKQFKRQLENLFSEMGIQGVFGYSEQGMQGKDFVSFDVGSTFISEFTSLSVPA